MNIIKYINKYGDLTFDEKPLNEVDKLIFGLLSYVRYNGTVSKSSKNKKTLNEVANEYFSNIDQSKKFKNIMAVRGSIRMLRTMKDKKRYCQLFLYNDIYIADDVQQFSALCIEINPHLIYVSFEGTDHMISGWEEDFKMSYQFPVKAQREAIKYLNKHFTLKSCKIIVGGHSKGGNLALVASMYSNFFVKRKIVNIYSYDGPGLMKKQIESKKYKSIENKFIHVIPNNSIIGLLLRHTKNYKVVKSNYIGLVSHFAESWRVTEDSFEESKLGLHSQILEKSFILWLDNYDLKQRELFVKELFDIFRKLGINSLIDIADNPKILIDIFKMTSKMDPLVGKMTRQFFEIFKRYFKQIIKEKFISRNKILNEENY